MEPELARSGLAQRHRNCNRVVAGNRLLEEPDHFTVVDLCKTQIGGLQQGGIASSNRVERADVVLDISGLVPIPSLQLVLLGVQIFLFSRDRLVLEQLESVVDAVVARQRCRERDTRLEDPRLAALEMERQD